MGGESGGEGGAFFALPGAGGGPFFALPGAAGGVFFAPVYPAGGLGGADETSGIFGFSQKNN